MVQSNYLEIGEGIQYDQCSHNPKKSEPLDFLGPFFSFQRKNEENSLCLPNFWNKKSCQNGRVEDYFHG